MKRGRKTESDVEETIDSQESLKKRKLSTTRKLDVENASEASSDSTAASTLNNIEDNSALIKNFRVSEKSLSILAKKGIATLFPIQFKTFDTIYEGKHVIGRARTGTGKTLAFSLPSIEALISRGSFMKGGVFHNVCRMLVLLPTRELAQQVASEVETLQCGRFNSAVVVGGLPEDPQLRALRQGGNVVIGTPGRVLDFLKRKLLDLKKVEIVVLDEADQMLEMGFRDDVDTILDHIFDSNKKQKEDTDTSVQVLLFTATLPSWVSSVADKYMYGREKVIVDIVKGKQNQTATGIRQLGIVCGFHQRIRVLGDLMQLYAGSNGRCIVFTETKAQANQIAVDSGISHICQVLHGDIQQKQREITLKAFKDGKFKCLVATDVAARGLHVDNIELVIQMEPPKDVDTFVHRSGRTGRAGTNGTNIVFFSFQDAPFLASIEKTTGIKFKRVGIPQSEELVKATALRVADKLSKKNAELFVEKFRSIAEAMVEKLGATEAVSRLLCELSGTKKADDVIMSTLTGREGYKTYEIIFKHAEINHKGYIWKALKNALGERAGITEKLTSMILRSDGKGCVFDVPPELLEEWENAVKFILQDPRNNSSFLLKPATELPDLDDPVLENHNSSSNVSTRNPRAVGRNRGRGGNRSSETGRGGAMSSRGRFGDRGRGGSFSRGSSRGRF